MIVTVFRTRQNPDPEAQREHDALAPKLFDIVVKMPGFVSAKPFAAEDGEQLAIIEFEDEAALEAWATHPDHLAAKRMGRDYLLAEYRVQICKVIKTSIKPS